jgi:uncharacterized NAD(P)/FAD-binding protein YdhS
MSTRPARGIAIVGAGASGALTAIRLLQQAERHSTPFELWLIDPADHDGRGSAYGTDDPSHLLNVPAGRMSAFAEDPDHFVRWLARQDPRLADANAYIPRLRYGAYLADTLDHAVRRHRTAPLRRIRDRVISAGGDGTRLRLGLASGAVCEVDAAVLALGNFAPSCAWAPAPLLASSGFIADPWAPGALAGIPSGSDVLLVGTGLTMADVALTLEHPGRTVHAVSRHGLLPHGHTTDPGPALAAPQLSGRQGLPQLRRAVLRHLAVCRRLQGDWRRGLDGLRPQTSALWQELPADDRARFLERDMRLWEVHRHRMPPSCAAKLDQTRRAGRLRVDIASVADAVVTDTGIQVHLSDDRVLRVGAVVNCTGARADLAMIDDPLLQDLFHSGLARTGPHGLGFDTEPDGRLHAACGQLRPMLWTLGALRRGQLFETTAIPEIRLQAQDIAGALVRQLSAARYRGPASVSPGPGPIATAASADANPGNLGPGRTC